ncbi:hypothetical protein IAQ61_005853 [Plenodomus lingam]|uniref:uncharacterized protein n=1 Tax=Leptosphaeria maculans TaxID=5022 RepID=UPI003317DCD0|nr:hypothetical protein IAQ61_005853 [Plenodomus lingam]
MYSYLQGTKLMPGRSREGASRTRRGARLGQVAAVTQVTCDVFLRNCATSNLEPLNSSLAPRNLSSPSSTPFDFTSSTTASHQTPWHSSPAPQAYRQPSTTRPHAFDSPQDFVLFDQSAQVPQRPQRAPSAPPPPHTFNNGHFYANSAPSSTTELQQPQLRQRPPVPLFSSSSNNTPQLNNATTMAGTVHDCCNANPKLTMAADLNSNNSFDSGISLLSGFRASGAVSLDGINAFTAVNDPSVASGSTRTVSPKDIFNDAFGSNPPSTAFTNLTSPDINDTPYMFDSFNCSPSFEGDFCMPSDDTSWPSLFPEVDNTVPEPAYVPAAISLPMDRTISSQSMERSGSSSIGSPRVLNSSYRRKSSVNNSPSINGISKARRRKGELPAITVDPSDKVALKRARNTLAARESRQRKFDHVSELERRNSELEADVEKWKSIAIALGHTGS